MTAGQKITTTFATGTATARQAARWPYIVVALCFAACFIRFPGEWDSDTVAQQTQMLSGEYRDWHPPVFAAFWRLLNTLWNSATGMAITGSGVLYVTHALMLWGGLALLVRASQGFFQRFSGDAVWKLAACTAFLLFFGLFEMVPMTRFVFKDTAMAAAYTLALGLMLNMPAQARLRAAVVAACLLLLFYGTAVRHNAIFSMLPLLVLLGIKALPRLRLPALAVLCLVLWGGIVYSIGVVNYTVLKAYKEYSLQELIYLDFWKLNYKTKTFDVPPLPEGQSWSPLTEDVFFRFYDDKQLYIVQAFRFINRYYDEQTPVHLRYDFSASPEAFVELRNAWVDKILKHPGAYISMHKKIFVELLREYSFMGFPGATIFAAGVLVVLAGGVALFRRKGRPMDPTPCLVTMSGLLYVLPYTLLLPTLQRRYLFWFFAACAFGIAQLAATAWMQRRDRLTRECPPPPQSGSAAS